MHGKQSRVKLDVTAPIFTGLPEEVTVGRYHLLAVIENTLPAHLREIARADDGEVMAVADIERKIYGLQFHPESIMTPEGKQMLRNFLTSSGIAAKEHGED